MAVSLCHLIGGRLGAETATVVPTVGRIDIVVRNVFDPRPNPRFARCPYPLLDDLHIKTRSRVIERELLFGQGDRFDAALAAETERNLRHYAFIGRVDIAAVPRDAAGDTVDVVVTTDDQWSTDGDVVADRRGNLNRLGIGVEEENLLGLGKFLNFRYQASTDRTLWRTIYRDPRLLGSRWVLEASQIQASDGSQAQVRLERPLYALSAKWSVRWAYSYENAVDPLYDDGRLSVAARRHERRAQAAAVRAWGAGRWRDEVALELSAGSRRYPGAPDVRRADAPSVRALLAGGPVERAEVQAQMRWAAQQTRYVKRRFIDRAGLVEDIRLGPSLSLAAGWARSLGTEPGDYGLLSLGMTETLAGPARLTVLSVQGEAHAPGARLDNANVTAFLHHYYEPRPWNTLVLGAAGHRTWGMDAPFQLVLGEDVGLRGYPARQFTGDRLVLLNLEDRMRTPLELGTVHLGFAPFADAGMAWQRGRQAHWRDLHTGVGLGLRLGVPKFGDAPVLRLDAAVPLRRARGGSRYSIGFSFAPIFRCLGAPDDTVGSF